MSETVRVHQLIDPKEVDLAAIERELDTLWSAPAEHTTRAAALNLIYPVHVSVSDSEISTLIAEVSGVHPARWMVIRIGQPESEAFVQAWVTAYCHRPERGAPRICSEVIQLEVAGGHLNSVASIVAALKLPGLPSALIWDASLPVTHEFLRILLPQIQRVITAVVPLCGTWASLKSLLDMRKTVGERAVISDLIWSVISPWRERIAELFDSNPRRARDLNRIVLHSSGANPPAFMIILAAWIMAVLNWQTGSMTERESNLRLITNNGKELHFLSGSPDEEFIEFHTTDGILRCDEPQTDYRFTSAIVAELRAWKRDPIVERVWDIVFDWCEAALYREYSS